MALKLLSLKEHFSKIIYFRIFQKMTNCPTVLVIKLYKFEKKSLIYKEIFHCECTFQFSNLREKEVKWTFHNKIR